jgi:hypothetical protein
VASIVTRGFGQRGRPGRLRLAEEMEGRVDGGDDEVEAEEDASP